MKIMLVEDDLVIAQSLATALNKWQYETIITENFEDILGEFKHHNPQLILMDLNLPNYNGYFWTQEIRKLSQVPIIFISSVGESVDMVMAIQMGADDYITKPIDMQVTISKIQALLRRTYTFSMEVDTNTYQLAGAILDTNKAKVTFNQSEVSLTFTELQILLVLFQAKGDYVAREKILDFCWQNDQFIDDNTLAVNMTRIRKKLRQIGLDNFIQTKKNYGYRIKAEPS
ncbi:response regulator transcription factor [Aerococcus viridans]|uniref:response regulator transcription factor n=1 Tax=Aerococcus viridans TaxID=1377 RepID=UPI00223BA3F7|nr:response regulator transcription factor [Aerococcus viridans]MCT1797294.1 response regulator transcription factor [Aerococcus viridans]